jgi:hypothetical protein
MNGVILPIPIRFLGVPRTIFRFILLKGFPETCNVMMFIVYGLGEENLALVICMDWGGMARLAICGNDRYSMGHGLDLLFPCFVVKWCLTSYCDVCNVYICCERCL